MALLMAIDPGGSIGVAMNIDGKYATCTLVVPRELWDMIKDTHPDMVAFEAFIGSGMRDRNINNALEMVGSIQGACHVLGIDYYPQQPQSRKAFLLEAYEILKGTKGTTVHERDALAHLLRLEWRIANGKL